MCKVIQFVILAIVIRVKTKSREFIIRNQILWMQICAVFVAMTTLWITRSSNNSVIKNKNKSMCKYYGIYRRICCLSAKNNVAKGHKTRFHNNENNNRAIFNEINLCLSTSLCLRNAKSEERWKIEFCPLNESSKLYPKYAIQISESHAITRWFKLEQFRSTSSRKGKSKWNDSPIHFTAEFLLFTFFKPREFRHSFKTFQFDGISTNVYSFKQAT